MKIEARLVFVDFLLDVLALRFFCSHKMISLVAQRLSIWHAWLESLYLLPTSKVKDHLPAP